MKITHTTIPGCLVLNTGCFTDARGLFIKPFSRSKFIKAGLPAEFSEDFFTVSSRNVLRGMHFQLPPHHHAKLVYCVRGRLIDAVIDLRQDSPTYRQHILVDLIGNSGDMLFIPAGCAHGFLAMEDNTIVSYKVTSEHSPESDSGVLWNSAGIKWPVTVAPIVSERDSALMPLDLFHSPF
jgi:dTDP-4-dehydrorhamnose 3,5-epimerase